jgi:dihydrofolate reductase
MRPDLKEPSVRELIVPAFVTIDGVMQAPGGPDEDPSGGFTYGGWAVNHWDETMYGAMAEMLGAPFDLLLGRRTYEIFAAHWPHVGEGQREERGGTASEVDDPAAAALNSAKKYVASRTLDAVQWNNSVLLQGDVADAVANLKTEDGPDIITQGSSDLIQTLLDHDLVDEFRIWTFPVVVGPGKRLFGTGTTSGAMRLVDAKTSSTGVVMATYRRTGDVDRGSFEFDQPTNEEVERRRRLAAER